GKQLAEEILSRLTHEVAAFHMQPVFCDILVGDDPIAEQYVRMKEKRAERIGMRVHTARFPETITTDALIQEIHTINALPGMCGLIVQLPLPPSIDTERVLAAIDPLVDVDVLNPHTAEQFYADTSSLVYPTARAIMHILETLPINLSEQRYVVVGQGRLVGKPVTHLLRKRGGNVEGISKETPDARARIASGTVIISAVGQDGLITGDMLQPGAVIIDAGTSESHGGIRGDVDGATLGDIPSYWSPVPGGVGPLTVACLLDNVLDVAKRKYPPSI
ncbi:MAG: bifunctional 5,10-methylenetetrahydrofolate dehydrogenase/5,10-methenyltetrahydrofolate cyclohydrolase, partial [Candidatus Pacebacteria bacterium]|nr:bifunctional 5,10-methylenetetrahydrofolate dehydrogenase/5,10-methenyltetrahydrofolate cyclohydrolase [Candidatus Paceibacterota bacterium]